MMFNPDDNRLKVIPDDEQLMAALKNQGCAPVYTYKQIENDDRIYCVRIAIEFKQPFNKFEIESEKYAIMTSRDSFGSNPREQDTNPFHQTNEAGEAVHRYYDISYNVLLSNVGQELMDLLESAVKHHYKREARNPSKADCLPIFNFSSTPPFHLNHLKNA